MVAIDTTVSEKDALFAKLTQHGQTHLLQFWDELSAEERATLATTIDSIDLPRIVDIFNVSYAKHAALQELQKYSTPPTINAASIQPIEADHYASAADCTKEQLSAYFEAGLSHIAKGEIAVVLLAGGQATRLGSAMPKATLPLNVKRPLKSLLGLYAAQLGRLQSLAKARHPESTPSIRIYIMTSPSTRAATLAHLRDDVLPLVPQISMDQVIIFEQSTLPCYDPKGKIILDSKTSIAQAPDGNGGLYSALHPYMPAMTSSGVKYVHVFCIDNILARPADPVFMAYCIAKGADCAAKVCPKTEPTEAVGVVCCVEGTPQVVEYSELSAELAARKDENDPNKLALRAGNIANHYFSVEFLENACATSSSLEFHVANKKIPYIAPDGTQHKPSAPNGVKMEQFVFDVFKQSKSFYVWEVARDDEFAPLKNPDSAGKDCPSTSVAAMHALHAKWFTQGGGVFDASGVTVEFDPSVTYSGEDLDTQRCNVNGMHVKEDTYFS